MLFRSDLVPYAENGGARRDRLVTSLSALERHEDRMHTRLREGLEKLPGVRLYAHAKSRTPTEFFAFEGHDSSHLATELAKRDINAPSGSFYAYEPCRALGLGEPGALRAGIAPYTSTDDVDRLLEALGDMVRS